MEFEIIAKIIGGVLNISPDTISKNDRFIEDLEADSIDIFQIIMEIEEALDLKVDTEKATRVETVGEAVELINSTFGN